MASLGEWREWLERLAERFAELAPPPGATAPERSRAVQRAAVRLVTVVVDATQAEDAWYALCERTLTWYLDAAGIAGEAAAALVDEAIGGRFASWVTPEAALVDTVGADLARACRADH
ncbi:hypothetical protein [Kitasatospora sp. NPDC090308]|uniref:hypothetical protein n=1 Tax=Kitasatospora sp. NPDC090308 TaxID=3364082 RepID=UPI0037F7BC9C